VCFFFTYPCSLARPQRSCAWPPVDALLLMMFGEEGPMAVRTAAQSPLHSPLQVATAVVPFVATAEMPQRPRCPSCPCRHRQKKAERLSPGVACGPFPPRPLQVQQQKKITQVIFFFTLSRKQTRKRKKYRSLGTRCRLRCACADASAYPQSRRLRLRLQSQLSQMPGQPRLRPLAWAWPCRRTRRSPAPSFSPQPRQVMATSSCLMLAVHSLAWQM